MSLNQVLLVFNYLPEIKASRYIRGKIESFIQNINYQLEID